MSETRVYCERHEATHRTGDCPLCVMRESNREHCYSLLNVAFDSYEANRKSEEVVCRLMQDADLERTPIDHHPV